MILRSNDSGLIPTSEMQPNATRATVTSSIFITALLPQKLFHRDIKPDLNSNLNYQVSYTRKIKSLEIEKFSLERVILRSDLNSNLNCKRN